MRPGRSFLEILLPRRALYGSSQAQTLPPFWLDNDARTTPGDGKAVYDIVVKMFVELLEIRLNVEKWHFGWDGR